MSELKKVPKAINTEDLLKILDQKTETVLKDETVSLSEYKNDVLAFLSALGIEPGEERIKKQVIYSIYNAWSKEPISRKEFDLELNKYFCHSSKLGDRFFKINKNSIKLTHEAYLKFNKQHSVIKNKSIAQKFQDFLTYNALKPGDFWLEESLFFFVYDAYSHKMRLNNAPNNRLSPRTFSEHAKLNFKHKNTANGTIYGLSDNVIGLFQPGQLDRMRKQNAKETKKTNKKKQTTIPGPRPKIQSKNKG